MRRFALMLFVLAACGGSPSATTSSTVVTTSQGVMTTVVTSGTKYGLTPSPTRPGLDGVIEAYHLVGAHADLIAHHLDRCIPWAALEAGTGLPADVEAELSLRAQQTPPGLEVYVATGLSTLSRDATAVDCAGGPGPELDAPDTLPALTAWVDLLIARLDPAFLNVGVEFNLTGTKVPALYEPFVDAIVALADHVHAEHPGVDVLVSVQIEFPIDDAVMARIASAVDLIGISTYPTVNGAIAVPDDEALDALAAYGLPLVVAESGWPGDDDPQAQADFVAWLGRMAQRHLMPFVVWFFPGDPDPLFAAAPPELVDIAELFGGMGLVATDGTERPALAVWEDLRAG